MNHEKINEQLDELYKKHWHELSNKLKKYNQENELKASHPLLLKLGQHFKNFDFNNRGGQKIVMCFGQETNGNGGEFLGELKGYEELINQQNCSKRYAKEKFTKSHKNYHRWCGVIAHRWLKEKSQELFNTNSENVFVIWNNIRKISTTTNTVQRGKIGSGLKEITETYFKVIPQELEIIKPDLLFFCTGNNDADIERFIGNIENEKPLYKFSTSKGEGNLRCFTINGYKAVRGYYPKLNSAYWKEQKNVILKEKFFLV